MHKVAAGVVSEEAGTSERYRHLLLSEIYASNKDGGWFETSSLLRFLISVSTQFSFIFQNQH